MPAELDAEHSGLAVFSLGELIYFFVYFLTAFGPTSAP